MAIRSALPFINYTARDWSSIRDAVVEHLRKRFPDDFTDITESNLGVAFIEAIAYMYEVLSFGIDRAANENFLATAQQRDSVAKLVGLLGYRMAPSTAASVSLYVTDVVGNPDRVFPILITQGSVISAGDVDFEVDQNYTISKVGDDLYVNGVLAVGEPAISAVEGSSATDNFTGTDSNFQSFTLSQPSYIDNTISLSVNGVVWTPVDSIALGDRTTPSNENIYELSLDSDDRVTVRFGDGTTGNRPNGPVVVSYRTGGGQLGNVAAEAINTTVSVSEAVGSSEVFSSTVTVTNYTSGSGGSDRESIANAKTFAPAWARAMDRAITLNDYEALTNGYSDGANGRVAKASVLVGPSDGMSNVVTVYALTEDGTGRLIPIEEQSPLSNSLYNFLDSRRCVTAYLSPIQGGEVVNIDVDLAVRISTGFDPAVAKRRVEAVVDTLFRSARVRYDNKLNLSWIHDYVVAVPGVVSCSLQSPSLRLINKEDLGGGVLGDLTVAELVDSPTATSVAGTSSVTLTAADFTTNASSYTEDFFVGSTIEVSGQKYVVLASDAASVGDVVCIVNRTVDPTLNSAPVSINHPRKFRTSSTVSLLPTESTEDLVNRRLVFKLLSSPSSNDVDFSIDGYDSATGIFSLGRDFSVVPKASDTFFIAPDYFVEGVKSIDMGNVNVTIEEGVS